MLNWIIDFMKNIFDLILSVIYTKSNMENNIPENKPKKNELDLEIVQHAQYLTVIQISDMLGKFTYTDNKDKNGKYTGWITIDPNWIKENIATVELGVIGKIRCHKKVKDRFVAMFKEIQEKCPEKLDEDLSDPDIDVTDTKTNGGCFAARHISFDVNRSLSVHSFGGAIDLMPFTNQMGTKGNMPQEIIDIADKHGFYWGGQFKNRDDMHFQIGTSV